MIKYKFIFTDEPSGLYYSKARNTWYEALTDSAVNASIFYVFENEELVGLIADTTEIDSASFEYVADLFEVSADERERYHRHYVSPNHALWKLLQNEPYGFEIHNLKTKLTQRYLRHALNYHQSAAEPVTTGTEDAQSGY